MSFVFDEYDAIRSITRSSYYEFVQEFWEEFCPEKPVWNWHIELMCNEIQEVMERVFRGMPKEYDLLINICPGSTKSSVASIAMLPWCWTRMPTLRSINGSHTQDLVLELSRKSRDIIRSEKYHECFPHIIMRDDQDTKGHFVNTKGGSRFCATVGGKTPTGMHAHVQVIDDPIDPEKAKSDIEILMADSWMVETLSTRKIDKSVTPLILIMQRLAQHDPSGMMIERAQKRGKLKHICIPAELTDEVKPVELREKYIDGLMDPIRIPRSVLEEEAEKGDYFYSGQFLQNPIPIGGGMFKTDCLVWEDMAPNPWHFKKIVRYWDNAGTPGKNKKLDRRRAYTVGFKMGHHKDGSFWILDVVRGRWRTDDREARKKQVAKRDGVNVRIFQEQEPGSGGQDVAEDTVRNLSGFSITLVSPKGEKELRADPFSKQVNTGNVHIVKADWNHELLQEMKHYPFSTFKDQIDAGAGAFSELHKLRRKVGVF